MVKTTWSFLTRSPSLNLRGPRKPLTRARSSTLSTAAARPMNSAWLAIGLSSAGCTSTAGGGAPAGRAPARSRARCQQTRRDEQPPSLERRSRIVFAPARSNLQDTALIRQHGHGISGRAEKGVAWQWCVGFFSCCRLRSLLRGRPICAAQNRSSFQIPPSTTPTWRRSTRAIRRSGRRRWRSSSPGIPTSVLRTEACEHAMAAWHAANQPAKADASPPSCCRAIPTTCTRSPTASTPRAPAPCRATVPPWRPMVAAAERGLAALPQWQKPASLDDGVFARTSSVWARVFNGALGYAALQAKDYDKARRYYREAVAAEPANLQDVYQLAVAAARGHAARCAGLLVCRALHRHRARRQERGGRRRHRPLRPLALSHLSRQRGRAGTSCWRASSPATARRPRGFVKSIPRALTPPEAALHRGRGARSRARSPSPTGRSSCAIATPRRRTRRRRRRCGRRSLDKQQGGGTRLKIPVKVISATPDVIEAAHHRRRRRPPTRRSAHRHGTPAGAAARGRRQDRDHRHAERLPAAALPVHHDASRARARNRCRWPAAPAPIPRPQMCTRDYRPACGLRRDGSRKTYGNACSACSDPEVVSQAAGACP